MHKIDSHKLMYHPQAVNDWLNGKEVYPIYLEVSPSGACNQRCSFCALDYMGYKPDYLDVDKLKDRWEEMAGLGVKSIMLGGEGEPLLNKDRLAIICTIKEAGIDLSITTNGVLINGSFLVRTNEFTWIKISINAGTRDTYKKIHGKDDFDKVVRSMKCLVRLRKKWELDTTIGAQMVLLSDNYHEIPELVSVCENAGMDYLVIKPYSQHPLSKKTKFKVPHMEKWETQKLKVIYRDDKLEKKYDKCYAVPYFWAYVQSNADVYACSNFLGDKRFKLGNLYKQSFKEIWEGDKRKEVIGLMDSIDVKKECRPFCRMNRINEYLYELKHPDKHVNFL